ncbi:hypothetical protein Goklo_012055 [Gossypium klotzschianum]|uniref:Uncharacterized protein n=1 Tax=Gossypium klotzschianum TaxID=34286 RepID=A0A7J8VBC7_9ROSI|nr:hypothetical protein [Gossypium klotzschianum]
MLLYQICTFSIILDRTLPTLCRKVGYT